MSDFSGKFEAPSDGSGIASGYSELASSSSRDGWSYEATVADIEAIINRIEMGELELAEVFEQFSTAVEQLRQCESFLAQQQQQMDLLIETLLDEPETY